MKNGLLLVATLLISTSSFAQDTVAPVNCSSPKMLAGSSADISGLLTLEKIPTGAFKATGSLKIKLVEGRSELLNDTFDVLGQFDKNDGINAYATLGAMKNGEVFEPISIIHLNFDRDDSSYIEVDDKTFMLNCK